MYRIALPAAPVAVILFVGCQSSLTREADREVYRLIESRQRRALGTTADATLRGETAPVGDSRRMFARNPRPLEKDLPAAFQTFELEEPEPDGDIEAASTEDAAEEEGSPQEFKSASIFTDEELERVAVFGLQDALAYAMRNAPELQDRKEDLYITALDLTLQRHLWTPQFLAEVEGTVTGNIDKSSRAFSGSSGVGAASDAGMETGSGEAIVPPIDLFGSDPGDLDRTFETISTLRVSQRLPGGGTVTAEAIYRLMRQVRDHVDKGSSADFILSADIPLLRGAGDAADTEETRLSAERELVYEVRAYERFRRSFAVEIASAYFELQQDRARIDNSFKAYQNRKLDWEKADFIHQVGQSKDVNEAPRARESFRRSEVELVTAQARYESALDRFKISIGMPIDELLDVVGQDEDEAGRLLDAFLPDVGLETSVNVATVYRLDLLTSADAVDDARRGVRIAKNQILPDLDLLGSVSVGAGDVGSVGNNNLRHDRTDWSAGFAFSTNDRKAERNAYRTSLVAVRKAARDHELLVENVRAEIRGAIRGIGRDDRVRSIEELNVQENETRLEAARAQFDLGTSTNQDVVDAEASLLNARNSLAAAIAGYRISILDYRLQTGTLRVTDKGQWGADPGGAGP